MAVTPHFGSPRTPRSSDAEARYAERELAMGRWCKKPAIAHVEDGAALERSKTVEPGRTANPDKARGG
jgi:hypothetical protein